MKQAFLITLCFCSLTAMGQNSFYLQPFVGGGASNVNHVTYSGSSLTDDYAVDFDGGLLVGCRRHNWVFTAGLEYMTTGSKVPLAITDALGNSIGSTWFRYRFSHLVMPLGVGRIFAIGKLTLTPSVGVGLSYNMASIEKIGVNNWVHHEPGGESNTYTGGTGVYGFGQAELALPLTKEIALTLAPTFNYMISRMVFPQQNPDAVYDHDYALLLNIGIKWKFGAKAKQPEKSDAQAR